MDAGPRPRLQLTDEGVSPGVDHIEFMLERRWQRRSYADIVAVTLQSNALPDSAVIANCRIEFEDGAEVVVSSANANGLSDGSRNGDFDDFVHDLHGRLLADGAAADIAFRAGFKPWRRRLLLGGLLAAAALLVVLPIGVFIATRRPELLAATLVGVGLMLPGVALVGPNRPRSYRPDAPPGFFA